MLSSTAESSLQGPPLPRLGLSAVIGNIKAFAGRGIPESWAACDGTLLRIDEYRALYAVIGARFGGDGVTTFALPELTGEHRFAICHRGYFPLEGALPSEWSVTHGEEAYVVQRARAFQTSYANGIDPFGEHPHVDELDPGWLARQARVLMDAYSQGNDPLHRHLHLRDLDPGWVSQQAQVLIDAYGQGRDPLHRHLHISHLDPSWLARQAQVLKDAYNRHSHPLHRHDHASTLDPDWLERQAQSLIEAFAQDHHPHLSHLAVEDLDPGWLEAECASLMESYGSGRNPLAKTGPDSVSLRRIEGIGPKIASLLAGAGIATMQQLAAASVSELRAILREAGITIADPATWPEQAALAAAGRWDDLRTLQNQLKAGRRV